VLIDHPQSRKSHARGAGQMVCFLRSTAIPADAGMRPNLACSCDCPHIDQINDGAVAMLKQCN
jgi:hypothetical protein